MSAITDIITYDDSLTVRNIYETLTDTLAVWNPFNKHNKVSPILQIEDDNSQLEDYSEVYKVKYNYFFYMVTVVETEDGPMLKGGRVPDNNFSDFETAKKIYNSIIYSNESSIRAYLVRSPEGCDDEFLCSSVYNKDLDTGLPLQNSKFTVVLFRKTKKD